MDTRRKLAILADAAKYDASCAASAAQRVAPRTEREAHGICLSATGDGRQVALLKVLLTNHCIHDCGYCVNRRSSGVERARFRVDEVVRLTLDFHRRGLVEGLFLSSGVLQGADHTMEQLVAVARSLRVDHHFRGYVHLKTIPGASPELVAQAGRWADRLSVNVELPTQADLDAVAPEKRLVAIRRTMDQVRDGIVEAHEEQRRSVRAPAFAPAGQTTQMIVGATEASDATLLAAAESLYVRQRLRRVYYGSFAPIPEAPAGLPAAAPPAAREHRLYQADWLLRFYGFAPGELAPADAPDLPLDLDPKLAWALRERAFFPVDVNRAPSEALLRVPGFGRRTVARVLQIRRWHRLRIGDLVALRVPVRRALPFVVLADHNPHVLTLDSAELRRRVAPWRDQMELFGPGPLAGAST